MAQEHPKSDMPEVAEKRPEEAKSQQIASIIEAWEEAHKVREKFIRPELWQQLTDQVGNLNFIRQFDLEGKSEEFKTELAKMAKLGEQLRKTEQRVEQVKEGKKFTAIIGKALTQLGAKRWFDFWGLGFGSGSDYIGTTEDFEDLGRFIETKFSPPIKKLERFAFYQVPGSDLIFEMTTSDALHKVLKIVLIRDRDGEVKKSLERDLLPSYS